MFGVVLFGVLDVDGCVFVLSGVVRNVVGAVLVFVCVVGVGFDSVVFGCVVVVVVGGLVVV
jgi:hypothetical protein